MTDYAVLLEDRVLVPFCVDSDEMDQLRVKASFNVGLLGTLSRQKSTVGMLWSCWPSRSSRQTAFDARDAAVLLAVVFAGRPSAAVVTEPFCDSQSRAGGGGD